MKGKTRPLILDPEKTEISSETEEQVDARMYKTTNRAIYDEASARARMFTQFSLSLADVKANKEILLRTSSHLLETATSNIAIQTGRGEWITPKLDRGETPFLDGVMRRYLLDQGLIKEGELSVEDLEKARRAGRRVIGFNGLR